MLSSGPGKVFGVRNTVIRAALSQIPACVASAARSITATRPMPARVSANEKAQPLCPAPTIMTLWSIPGRSGTQSAGSGPSSRNESRAAASGSPGSITTGGSENCARALGTSSIEL
jgi:hypothetical protein